MAIPQRTSLLRRLLGLATRRPASVALSEDACDMGTAIGLDFALDQRPTDREIRRAAAQRRQGKQADQANQG